MSNTPFTRYALLTAGMIVLILLLVVSYNRLIDPFSYYDGPRYEKINIVKPYFSKHLRMTKANAVRHQKPTGILLGSSRGEVGLDPLHPGWDAKNVYNLSIASSSIYESFRYFQHAHAIQPLQQVVLGLGLRQFNYNELTTDDFSEESLAVTVANTRQIRNVLKNFIETNASLKTLKYSLKTHLGQNETVPYFSNGEYNPGWLIANMKGRRKDFIKNEENYCKKYFNNFSFTGSQDIDSTLHYYRRLLKTAYNDSIDLKILIYPSHARQWEVIEVCNELWNTWEEWKRQLVEINEDEATRANQPAFDLWDFSGYNIYSTENVPAMGNTDTSMQWYWESAHFKKELGDLVLNKIFNYSDTPRQPNSDFGIIITSKNIESHLKKISLDKKIWRENHPEDVKEIRFITHK